MSARRWSAWALPSAVGQKPGEAVEQTETTMMCGNSACPEIVVRYEEDDSQAGGYINCPTCGTVVRYLGMARILSVTKKS
jgi:hypothetical protein